MATLEKLQTIEILPAGRVAQLRTDLAEIRSLFEIDEVALRNSVVLPNRPQPRPIDGPSAAARLEDCERRAHDLVNEWTEALQSQLNDADIADQVRYVDDEATRSKIEKLASARILPDDIDAAFVEAINQVFKGVDVRHVSPSELSHGLFPRPSPVTADQLRQQLEVLLAELTAGADPERVRFLRKGDDES